MDTRTYKIGFYQLQKTIDSKLNLFDFIKNFSTKVTSIDIAGDAYQIRDLNVRSNVINSCFARLRHSDIPKIGEPGKAEEKDIPFENDDQGLIEKTFFNIIKTSHYFCFSKIGRADQA